MVADALAPTTRAAHDIGLAAWLDGSMPGNFAPNPSLEKRLQPHDRRSVSMAARSGYNRIDALGQGATAGRAARALTEGPQHCSPVRCPSTDLSRPAAQDLSRLRLLTLLNDALILSPHRWC
jgi:hypothetical protein